MIAIVAHALNVYQRCDQSHRVAVMFSVVECIAVVVVEYP